jgi:hypothetical protein
MSVALTETTMIALYRRLDQARCIAGRALQLILTEADGYWLRQEPVSPKLIRQRVSGGGREAGLAWHSATHVLLDSRPNQAPQLFVVHSTNSN